MGVFRGVELDGLVLESERLVLRPWLPADAEAIAAALSPPQMHRFLSLPRPYTTAAARAFVHDVSAAESGERAAGIGIDCAVVERTGGTLVGSASLRLPYRMRPCDIGYWIAPAAQGRGYASEATRTLAGWAFGQGVHRVELHLDVRNIASARVALAAGFSFDGVRRDVLHDDAGRADLAVFGRVATDPGAPVPPRFPPLPDGGLSDGVLTLRALEPGDLDGFAAQEDDPVTRQTGFTGTAPTREAMRHLLDRARLDHLVGAATYFAMVADGRYAGSIALRLSGPPDVGGIGYAVHPACRGRGFTTRALRLLADWAFDSAGFVRLELGAKVDNAASRRAAEAAGFVPEGVFRSRLRRPDGSYRDEARYALLRE